MATVKRSKSPGAGRPTRSPKYKNAKGVLEWLAPDELATVLRTLLKVHPDLRSEAESIAVEMVASPSAEDIANDVYTSVTALEIEAFQGRAGRQPGGYVDPTEAAWELLQEAIEDVVADMKRRMGLGLDAAAEAICCGIVVGLYKARNAGSDGLLGWAPDFPVEEACHAVAEVISTCPMENRGVVRDRLIGTLSSLVPDWSDMISRAAERAAQCK